MKVVVKKWFVEKIERPFGYQFFCSFYDGCEVVQETEKAYKLETEIFRVDGEYEKTFQFWCPKSCTISIEEHEEMVKAAEKRFEDGAERYQKMVDFCKANKVKGVRVGLRKDTILKKIAQAGLSYTY